MKGEDWERIDRGTQLCGSNSPSCVPLGTVAATLDGRLSFSISASSIILTPHLPARIFAHALRTPVPRGVTRPRPVTTTLLCRTHIFHLLSLWRLGGALDNLTVTRQTTLRQKFNLFIQLHRGQVGHAQICLELFRNSEFNLRVKLCQVVRVGTPNFAQFVTPSIYDVNRFGFPGFQIPNSMEFQNSGKFGFSSGSGIWVPWVPTMQDHCRSKVLQGSPESPHYFFCHHRNIESTGISFSVPGTGSLLGATLEKTGRISRRR